ncbi:MAG: TolC family protein [Bacteroidota bacterium]
MYFFHCLNGKLSGQKKLRLIDCFEIAVTNGSEIKNAGLEFENAQKELKSVKQNPFPTLNASVSHNLNYNSGDKPLFGQYSGNLTASGSMPVFEWLNVWKEIQLANRAVDYQETKVDQQKFSLLLSVTEEFFNLLLRHEQLMAGKRQLAITDTILKNTKELYEAGKIISTDVEESKLQFLKEKKNVINSENAFNQALVSLKKVMQVSGNIEIDYNHYSDKKPLSQLLAAGYETFEKRAVDNNPYLKLLSIQKQQAEINHQITKSLNRPYLDLNYSLSSNYSETSLRNSNMGIYDNLETSFGGFIELKLTIPIFNRGNYKKQKAVARNNIQKKQNNFDLELSNLTTLLNQQYQEAQSTNLTKQELKTIRVILKDKSQLQKIGKESIFTVLNYKQQFNEIMNKIMNKCLYLKFQSQMASNILNLYVNDKIWGTSSLH